MNCISKKNLKLILFFFITPSTYLNCRELLIYDLDHAFDLLGCDWSRPGLFSQQVHDVSREFVASLVVLLNLLLVDLPDLSKLVLVVRVFDGRAVLAGHGRGRLGILT